MATNKALGAQLLKRMDEDVALREALADSDIDAETYQQKIEELCAENAVWLEKIISQLGWPGLSQVDYEGAEAAWYIAQNAISMPQFMRGALQLMHQELENENVPHWQYAYLADAIKFFEGKPQRYGTQFDWNREGAMVPWELAEPEKVNEYRKQAGLNTIEDRSREILLDLINSGEEAPENFDKRKKQFQKWQKAVGWVK
jgi:hypothetical protein